MTKIPKVLRRYASFWSAVAKRSADTAFGCTALIGPPEAKAVLHTTVQSFAISEHRATGEILKKKSGVEA